VVAAGKCDLAPEIEVHSTFINAWKSTCHPVLNRTGDWAERVWDAWGGMYHGWVVAVVAVAEPLLVILCMARGLTWEPLTGAAPLIPFPFPEPGGFARWEPGMTIAWGRAGPRGGGLVLETLLLRRVRVVRVGPMPPPPAAAAAAGPAGFGGGTSIYHDL
jgi:hypothetical protein